MPRRTATRRPWRRPSAAASPRRASRSRCSIWRPRAWMPWWKLSSAARALSSAARRSAATCRHRCRSRWARSSGSRRPSACRAACLAALAGAARRSMRWSRSCATPGLASRSSRSGSSSGQPRRTCRRARSRGGSSRWASSDSSRRARRVYLLATPRVRWLRRRRSRWAAWWAPWRWCRQRTRTQHQRCLRPGFRRLASTPPASP
mmetsp:Transcript_39268/g.116822  ORF Transcript_39268/g.116822 Transcript_39268/m.116822 type:complete len:205 (+) Transcript_39268:1377-1991(+)